MFCIWLESITRHRALDTIYTVQDGSYKDHVPYTLHLVLVGIYNKAQGPRHYIYSSGW